MIVLDAGCKSHGYDISVPTLIERFHPTVLFGFDPHPELVEGTSYEGDTRVVLRRCALWIYEGMVGYTNRGIIGTVLDDEPAEQVCCVDIAAWLRWAFRNTGEPIVLKLDVEGAEYGLLHHILREDVDALIERILVDWHQHPAGYPTRNTLEAQLRCPVEEW